MTDKPEQPTREELLPCPFCGGEATISHPPSMWEPGSGKADPSMAVVVCKAMCQPGYQSTPQAIAAWNTRAERTQSPDLREALRLFVGCAYPVAAEINRRGYNWSEAYLDGALPIAQAALASLNSDAPAAKEGNLSYAAIVAAEAFIRREYADPSREPEGDWIAKEARPVRDLLCAALGESDHA